MKRSTDHPARFAEQSIHRLFNTHGDFVSVRLINAPALVRAHLQHHTEVTLLQRTSDPVGSVTTLFRHEAANALVLLSEMMQTDSWGDPTCRGELIISATTHEDLVSALVLCDLDTTSPETFLDRILVDDAWWDAE